MTKQQTVWQALWRWLSPNFQSEIWRGKMLFVLDFRENHLRASSFLLCSGGCVQLVFLRSTTFYFNDLKGFRELEGKTNVLHVTHTLKEQFHICLKPDEKIKASFACSKYETTANSWLVLFNWNLGRWRGGKAKKLHPAKNLTNYQVLFVKPWWSTSNRNTILKTVISICSKI